MKRPIRMFGTAALVALAADVASAADDPTSLSYISYVERYATVRAAQGDEPLDAVVNMPVLVGDRLETARGARVEVQLADGSTVWIDELSTVDFDGILLSRDADSARTALYLADDGGLALEIPTTAAGRGSVRLDTPLGTLYLDRPGLYRVEVRSGQLHVQARSGLAELPDGVGSSLLRGGQEAWINADGRIDRATLAADRDDFWNWVEERRHPAPQGQTVQYVDSSVAPKAYLLDSYGEWVYVPTYSTYMWRPRVAAGWVPYSYGRWVWTPVGWTWVSYEPWGWYPYHYGSWYWDASIGWAWTFDSIWGPAWVHWMYTSDYVGWCPRGYYDYWYFRHVEHRPGRPGHFDPRRWRDSTLDFSGRVRLRQVDPRPWTMVPADQLGSSHIERVRLDSSRFFRDAPDDRYAHVRSGPLLSEAPGRLAPGRVIEGALRSGGNDRDRDDLSPVLRRETGGREDIASLPIRPVRTDDVIRSTRSPNGLPARPVADRATGHGGWNKDPGFETRSEPASGRSGTGNTRRVVPRGGVTSGSPESGGSGQGASGSQVPRSEPRSVGRTVERPSSAPQRAVPAPATGAPRSSGGVRERVESRPAPAPAQPRSQPAPVSRPDKPGRQAAWSEQRRAWYDELNRSRGSATAGTQVQRVERSSAAAPSSARSWASPSDLSRSARSQLNRASSAPATIGRAEGRSSASRSSSAPARSYSPPARQTSLPARSYTAAPHVSGSSSQASRVGGSQANGDRVPSHRPR